MMNDIPVYITAEDDVTKAIIKRLLAYCSPKFSAFKEIPARGSEIKKKINELNALAKVRPVILLTDLDTEDCAPLLKKKLLNGIQESENFIINIAIDEAEAWLMADRTGFSKFLGVSDKYIQLSKPMKMGGMRKINEMDFQCKASYYLTHNIAPKSSKNDLRQQISAFGTDVKGKEYNSAIKPFIETLWNIDEAKLNSDSLSRMINRLNNLAGDL